MIERLGGRAPGLPVGAPAGGAEVDGVDGLDGFLDGVDGAEAVEASGLVGAASAEGAIDALLAGPTAEHRARALDPGALSEALARVAGRPARPGEGSAEVRMREVAARYLALRLEVAEGVARISIG